MRRRAAAIAYLSGLCGRADEAPIACLFVDGGAAHVEAARAAGWVARLFRTGDLETVVAR